MLVAATLTLPVAASAQTPEAPGATGFRWYLAPAAQVSRVNGKTAVTTGLEFGWMKSDRLTLGLSSYRLASAVRADRPDAAGADDVEFFYAGITASYALILMPHSRLSIGTLVGGGEMHWRDGYWHAMPQDDHRDTEHQTSLVVEPRLALDYKVTNWMRADLTAGYRWVGSGKSHVLEQKDVRGFTGSVGFRFGRF
jgi:hypothetical protein